MNQRFVPFIMFGLLVLTLGSALLHQPAQPPQANRPLPVLALHPLATPDRSIDWQPEAGRFTLVNFFASWCVPCLSEHAAITTLSQTLPVVGIAWNDTPENLGAWLKKHGNPYRSVWLDHGGEAAIAAGIRGVPESFLIGPDGTVKLHLRGAITPQQQTAITTLVAEAAHATPAR